MPLYVKYTAVLTGEVVYAGPYSKDEIGYHYRDISGWEPALVQNVSVVMLLDELAAECEDD